MHVARDRDSRISCKSEWYRMLGMYHRVRKKVRSNVQQLKAAKDQGYNNRMRLVRDLLRA